MTTSRYLDLVSENLKEYINNKYSVDFSELEVIQVWYCKTIQNHKGLFIIKNLNTGFIYDYFCECTYNGEMQEMYIDFYSKEFKHIIHCG